MNNITNLQAIGDKKNDKVSFPRVGIGLIIHKYVRICFFLNLLIIDDYQLLLFI